MAISPILIYPHPILKTKCPLVSLVDNIIISLITNLIDTLKTHQGCVGIAASQIGVLSRVIVIDCSRGKKPNKNHGLVVLINPSLVKVEGEQITNEGCLSIPDYIGRVKRVTQVEVKFLNQKGNPQTIQAQDFEAVVLQHEIDHLDGILFLDRVACLKTDIFRRKFINPVRNKSR